MMKPKILAALFLIACTALAFMAIVLAGGRAAQEAQFKRAVVANFQDAHTRIEETGRLQAQMYQAERDLNNRVESLEHQPASTLVVQGDAYCLVAPIAGENGVVLTCRPFN